MMYSLNYKNNPQIKNDIKKLYLSAFPKEERPPAWIFFKNALKDNQDLYGYYDENEFIGFAQLTTYKDICYLFFLAVSKEKRDQGYGSKIIEDIKQSNNDKVILLCYEEVDTKYEDYEQRVKRRNFYRKNGFLDNKVKTNEFGVIFETGYFGTHSVTYEDYVEIFVQGFGEFARKYIKRAD